MLHLNPRGVVCGVLQVGPTGDFGAATKDVASLVYVCKEGEGCLSDQDWESTSSNK